MAKSFLNKARIMLAFVLVSAMFISLVVLRQVQVHGNGRSLEEEYITDELIVKFKDPNKLNTDFNSKHQIKSLQKVIKHHPSQANLDNIYLVQISDSRKFKEILESLKNDPEVIYAEPNYIVSVALAPNDANYPQLWALNNAGQSGGTSDADIDAPEAWNFTTSSNVVVGIVDTGIDYNHEDLAANMWTNPGEIAANGIDDDNNGFIDDIHGWDFVGVGDNDPMDDHGHGTHVAGTIAGVGNNSIGIAGVNWSGKVAALKFLNSAGSGSIADAVEAVNYANLMGFKITNNSWGGGGFSQALYDVISVGNKAGNLFVAAAGNSSVNADLYPIFPATYNLPNIISVAATDNKDMLATFSNYGATSVDLGAPGVSIFSTVPKTSCSLCNPAGYATLSGTSMATPHVAGAAALIWNYNPSLSHLDLKNKLMYLADPIGSLTGKTVSGARLNLYNHFDQDSIAPNAINNLSAPTSTYNSVTLSWTATGDDGSVGQANQYDIRYSTSLITENNFAKALKVTGEPRPAISGSVETFGIKGLAQNTTYYFAMKVYDNVGNISALSNIASGTTLTLTTIFFDDMEAGINGWMVTGTDGKNNGPALWHQSHKRSYSPVTSWYYGIEIGLGNYDTGARNYGSITSSPINLSGVTDTQLSFFHRLTTENNPGYDKASVIILKDNTPNTVLTKTSTNGLWAAETLDISSFDGSTIQVRFNFDTIDGLFNNFEGWFVDDVVIQGNIVSPTPTPTPITVFEDSFEVSEWNNLWTEDSQNNWSRSSEEIYNGNYAARFRGIGTDSQLISIPINLQGKTNATISFFWRISSLMDSGEYIAFDVSTDNGSTWQAKSKLEGNVGQENTWKNVNLNLSGINSLKLRFRGEANRTNKKGFVDLVKVTAQ